MITYHTIPEKQDITVKLDGKTVGKIIRCLGPDRKTAGWRYRPTGAKAGEMFPTIEACKRSLKG